MKKLILSLLLTLVAFCAKADDAYLIINTANGQYKYLYSEQPLITLDGQIMNITCAGHDNVSIDFASITGITSENITSKNGDVNGDSIVDISDVNAVISVICGNTTYANADVNGDGIVDISDVNAIISTICGN